MITLEQMRAARGLLNWSQSDLAQHADLSVTAMNNIDRGLSKPRVQTISHIQKVFENYGVEFIDGNGVRFRKDVFKIETFEGPTGFAAYLQDTLNTQIAHKSEGLHWSYDEPTFVRKNRKLLFEFYREAIKNKLKERILLCEGVTLRYGPSVTSEFRWISKEFLNHVGHSIYGDKYCMFLKNRIVVIENADVAAAYRKQFELDWKNAKRMPNVESLYDQDLREFGKE